MSKDRFAINGERFEVGKLQLKFELWSFLLSTFTFFKFSVFLVTVKKQTKNFPVFFDVAYSIKKEKEKKKGLP